MALHKSTAIPKTEGSAPATTEATNPVNPVIPAGKGSKNDASEARLTKEGKAIYETMSAEAIQVLGSKSPTLHFVNLLGCGKINKTRVVAGKTVMTKYVAGIVVRTDIDIEKLPVIPITCTVNTGVNPETDITYTSVKAGETFAMTAIEAMYFLTDLEYACAFEAKGVNNFIMLAPRAEKFFNASQKLPTPTFRFKEGSPKEGMPYIDEEINGVWVCKPEYLEKFGALCTSSKKASSARSRAGGKAVPNTHLVTLGLAKILGKSL